MSECFSLFSGGTFGRISVLVRTIGGGEPWDTHVGQNPGRTNETISEVLGNRDIRTKAVRGQDYQVLEQTVTFEVIIHSKYINQLRTHSVWLGRVALIYIGNYFHGIWRNSLNIRGIILKILWKHWNM